MDLVIPDERRSVYLFSCMRVLASRDWYCVDTSSSAQPETHPLTNVIDDDNFTVITQSYYLGVDF